MTARKSSGQSQKAKKAEERVEAAEEHPEVAPTPAAEEDAPEQPTAEQVYAGYVAPAVADRVEVRVNNKIVYSKDVYGASVNELASGGVSVKGSSEAPKSSKKSEDQGFYNPQEQESRASVQMSPVPTPDPELTEELDASATPDADEE
jgi:hypothetical protein